MPEDSSRSASSGLPLGIALASLIGFFTLGPIDFPRTAYNAVVGDIPLIREAAVDYSRKRISSKNPHLSPNEVESKLANSLNYDLKENERIDPQRVRMMEIWDAIEDHTTNGYHRWVWPTLFD